MTRGVPAASAVPTLFVELVDRADPTRPVTLLRRPVTVKVDTDADFKTVFEGRPGYRVVAGDVADGFVLGLGDVVVAYDWDDRHKAWLAEVVEADGLPLERIYTLATLVGVNAEERLRWTTRVADPRWGPAWNVNK